MDLHSAAQYLKVGYRIKRIAWEYVKYATSISGHIWGGTDSYEFSLSFSLDDLLADDWEIVLEGIVSDFPITYADKVD